MMENIEIVIVGSFALAGLFLVLIVLIIGNYLNNRHVIKLRETNMFVVPKFDAYKKLIHSLYLMLDDLDDQAVRDKLLKILGKLNKL